MKKEQKQIIFWTLMFIGALLILSKVRYSDGDDVFFYQYTRQMGFFEYLSWRYETWVGRMAGEAMVYLVFRQNIWIWRIINALMLVLLPMGILELAKKAARIPEGGIATWHQKKPVAQDSSFHICLPAMTVAGYLLMAATAFGYAAVWMNGSIFYTWSFTCGIWAMVPLADLVFDTGNFKRQQLIYSIPCAVMASMSIEQMGAVLLTFEVLGVIYLLWKKKMFSPGIILQTVVTLVAFFVLFSAPGNDLRVASEIINWMPQYESLSFGEHIFITVQWLISSFANENKLFLCGIWVIGILLLLQRERKNKSDRVCVILAGIFTVVACFPFIGVTIFSDMGMNIGDIRFPVEKVPQIADLTVQNIIALFWWGTALVFTFFYLWKISGFQLPLLLAYLAGIASEAILYCSPTMYASGARVFYLTDLLYLFLMITLSLELRDRKWRNGYYIAMIGVGIFHFLFQFRTFAIWL